MSQIKDHHVIALRLRFSDSGRQTDMSNETQEQRIHKWLQSCGAAPFVAMTIRHEHSAYEPAESRLAQDYARIKKYNHRNPNPITLLLHWDWSRWIRNAAEGNRWRYDFQKIGVEINTAEKWLDYENENDRLYVQFEQHMAENYSRAIGKNVLRANEGWRAKGYNPHHMTRFYFTHEGKGTKDRRNVWLPSRANLEQAISLILNGQTIRRAYDVTGGMDVHGHINTFSDNLRKEYLMARRGPDAFNYEPITTEANWMALQRILRDNKRLSRGERELSKAWLTGLIVADTCLRRVSRSTPKRNGKVSAAYYTCTCKPVRHYRIRREPAEEDMLEIVRLLGLSAERQAELSRKAEQRAAGQLKALKADARRLEKQKAEADELALAAKKKYVLDKITEADLVEFQSDARVIAAKLQQAKAQIANYGKILEAVKKSLADIGTFLTDHTDRLRLRDFLLMLFPDGLRYDPENRLYRTTKINAAYSLIGGESVSYSKIKFGVAISEMTTPEVGGRPVLSRTAQSDLSAFQRYVEKYA